MRIKMAETNQTHRNGTVTAALHIAENSKAESLEKINAVCLALYPDDLKAIENVIITALKNLIVKS